MGRITRLPAHLANQIAAGEVVERPASVVKELVENAIDAGARRIAVATEFGGKQRIRVEDDGTGMDPDDARLAVERHATSKLRSADDLAAIATLGFRGEALPSIASVSRFTLRTRARGAEAGTEVRVEGGLVSGVAEVGMAEGTVIDVKDLFHNLPARRKFLKSDAAESAQISRIVTQLALCYPEIGFSLTSGTRTVLECPPVPALRDRLYQLYGDEAHLVAVAREGGGFRVEGFVAALAGPAPVRGPQNVFVNRRLVRDRTITHAILDAYTSASIKERSPEVHLFVSVPLDAVDVNVHPTKAEVRFREQSHLHQFIRHAVADALGAAPAPELRWPGGVGRSEGHQGGTGSTPWAGSGGWRAPVPPRVYDGLLGSGGVLHGALHEGLTTDGPAADGPGAATPDPGGPSDGEATQQALATAGPGPLVPLGQFRDTFILAVDRDSVAIVDQHVAHERVLYERILERLRSGRLESQRLLEPLLVELPPAGIDALLSRTGELERLGFDIEGFGGGVVRVAASPVLLTREDCEAAIRALAEDLDGLDRGARVDEALGQIAATMACHAAVKAHDRLTFEKMTHILAELHRTSFSTICPHGRPVMLRLTRRELEKRFERI
ncbi:MAG: DNA mismatch repair endonuclease MutL [Vicinamibacterales bacterium]